MARLTGHTDRAAVGVDDEPHNAQPQADAAAFPRQTPIDLIERLEHPPGRRPGEPDPVIGHLEADVAVAGVRPQPDLFFLAGVFVSVVQQIQQHGD